MVEDAVDICLDIWTATSPRSREDHPPPPLSTVTLWSPKVLTKSPTNQISVDKGAMAPAIALSGKNRNGCDPMTLGDGSICNPFGANDVLKHVDFSIRARSAPCWERELARGKSTLPNILGGVLPGDRGNPPGQGPAHFRTPADSPAGIAFIHQELVSHQQPGHQQKICSSAERKPNPAFGCTMIKGARRWLTGWVGSGPPDHGQELDTLLQTDWGNFTRDDGGSLIIMDEPTTSLTDPEIERVFDMMRMLQKQNVAIVFISHKLKEVMEVCNRCHRPRDRNMVASGGGRSHHRGPGPVHGGPRRAHREPAPGQGAGR